MNNLNNAPKQHNRVEKRHIYRDTRSFTQILRQDLQSWDLAIVFLITSPIVTFYSPIFSYIVFPFVIFLSLYASFSKQNRTLPMKLPIFLKGVKDYNDVYPGQRQKYYTAGATVLLGNLQVEKSEVWIKGKDLLTHMMVIGTTGGGKTELLVSLAGASSFCMGGGLIYVDAKAAPKLLYQFVTLCRIFGREDDLRVINYQTGNKVVEDNSFQRLSNTTNPFAQGTANTAVQTLTGLLPSGGGDNQYFLDRAIAILRTLMPALVELRDQGIINIYPSLIGDCISIEKFIALGKNEIEFNGIKYPHIKISERSVKVINTFLKGLPNFNPSLPASQQPEEATKQFGFAEGYFARTLANLAGTYGHIYETDLAESDFVDIVMHNRILVVLVPAAESSSEERSALGKVVLSSIRVAMAQGLGDKGEGDRSDVLDSLPIDLRIPTLVIVDEYAEVAVDGFAVTATQGRGLGMSVVFAGQDLAGFERANEAEANMIFGNTNIKLLLKLQDPNTTWQRFKDLAGTMKVATGGGWDHNEGGLSTYKTQLSASIQEADILDINDLKGQIEGEAHLFEGSNVHRVKTFYHQINDNDLAENFRINRMLKVKVPSPDYLTRLRRSIGRNDEIESLEKSDFEIPEPNLSILFGESFAKHADGFPISVLNTLNETLQSPLTQINAIDEIRDNIEYGQDDGSLVESDAKIDSIDQDMLDLALEDNDANQIIDRDNNKIEPSNSKGPLDNTENTNDAKRGERPDLSDHLRATLSKTENLWIFNTVSSSRSSSLEEGAEAMLNEIVELNQLMGESDDDSISKSVQLVNDIDSNINYPSVEIQSSPQDPDDMWKLISDN